MEKIKASEVLKGYKYYARDTDGTNTIFKYLPIFVGEDWELENGKSGHVISVTHDISISEAKSSLREIDFSNDTEETKLEKMALSEVLKRGSNGAWREMARVSKYVGFYGNDNVFLSDEIPSELEVGKGFKIYEIDHSEESREPKTLQDLEADSLTIVPAGNIVESETMLSGTPVFKDFDGKLRPIGDLGRIVISSTKEPNSIFKINDTVYALSYSNVGEFGKSTDGIVKAIYKDGTVLVKVDEGIEEVHKEDNVSFTPFSIREAGFSQVRPVQDPMVGDWGFFYNQKPAKSFCYHQIGNIGIESDYPFITKGGTFYKYFSTEPPQLAKGVPNPFTKCQKPS